MKYFQPYITLKKSLIILEADPLGPFNSLRQPRARAELPDVFDDSVAGYSHYSNASPGDEDDRMQWGGLTEWGAGGGPWSKGERDRAHTAALCGLWGVSWQRAAGEEEGGGGGTRADCIGGAQEL